MKSEKSKMKKNTFFNLFAVAALSLAMAGCNPNPPQPNNNLIGKWNFVKIENKATSEITEVPQTFDIFDKAYLVEFRENGVIDFLTNCNVKTANYVVGNQNVISFSGFIPNTKLCCGDFYQWEVLLVNNLSQSLTYSITDNLLIIDCAENKLYFEKVQQPAQAIYVSYINCTLEHLEYVYTICGDDTVYIGTIGARGCSDFIPYQNFVVDGSSYSPVITLVGKINGHEIKYESQSWCGTMWYNLPYGYYTYKIEIDEHFVDPPRLKLVYKDE